VTALLHEQHADLAQLALRDAVEGWDNTSFRLGDSLAVRLPRRVVSATLIEHEQRWLPQLSQQLPLPIPSPVRIGRPGCGFPWAWSVVPWFPGESALAARPSDVASLATALGQFLQALHRPAPSDAPANPWRGIDLRERTELLRSHLDRLEGEVDRAAIVELWERVAETRPWPGPRVWLHGDLHPRNLVIENGRLSAVLDFGDLTSGDPATDLSVAWMVLPPSHRLTFRAAARTPLNPIDHDTWTRARGWALTLGVSYLANSRDDEPLAALGRTAIDAALHDQG
jgi:aminoglycoside phosphotransferase (APT) family kinase protein